MIILNLIAEMLGNLIGIPYFIGLFVTIAINVFLWKGDIQNVFEDYNN